MYPRVEKPTPNIGPGTNECLGVLLHHTGGSYGGAVAWLTNPGSRVSAHVIIAKDGTRATLAPNEVITWHAGRSQWLGRHGCNNFMVGVEFAGDTTPEPLTDDQLKSWEQWFGENYMNHGWTPDDVTDHRSVAIPAGRKSDLHPKELERALSVISWYV